MTHRGYWDGEPDEVDLEFASADMTPSSVTSAIRGYSNVQVLECSWQPDGSVLATMWVRNVPLAGERRLRVYQRAKSDWYRWEATIEFAPNLGKPPHTCRRSDWLSAVNAALQLQSEYPTVNTSLAGT